MSEQTPSRAEGEPDADTDIGTGREPAPGEQVPRTTPSQAEGARDDESGDGDASGGDSGDGRP